jgi:hypothetical protein
MRACVRASSAKTISRAWLSRWRWRLASASGSVGLRAGLVAGALAAAEPPGPGVAAVAGTGAADEGMAAAAEGSVEVGEFGAKTVPGGVPGSVPGGVPADALVGVAARAGRGSVSAMACAGLPCACDQRPWAAGSQPCALAWAGVRSFVNKGPGQMYSVGLAHEAVAQARPKTKVHHLPTKKTRSERRLEFRGDRYFMKKLICRFL